MNEQHIHVFVRHCNFSANSANKKRPAWFRKIWALDSLFEGYTHLANTSVTILFDGEPNDGHFLKNGNNEHLYKMVKMEGGNDGASFLNLINYVAQQKFKDHDILYFLEDDYVHRTGWCEVLLEGLNLRGVNYITLYDHPDKYTAPQYENLVSKIKVSESVHWRSIPSTTNTYAMLAKTFLKDIDIHRKFCDLGAGFTKDHEKFIELWQSNRTLYSCMPAYATHCEEGQLSPTIKWQKII